MSIFLLSTGCYKHPDGAFRLGLYIGAACEAGMIINVLAAVIHLSFF